MKVIPNSLYGAELQRAHPRSVDSDKCTHASQSILDAVSPVTTAPMRMPAGRTRGGGGGAKR